MSKKGNKLGLSDKLNFGKHKGQIVSEVMLQDFKYFTWMDETSELLHTKFKEEVYLKYVTKRTHKH